MGGAEDSVQLHSEPPPAAPLTDMVTDVVLGGVAYTVEGRHLGRVVELHPEDDEAWTELLNILSETADDGTMGNVQSRTYRLYTFMEKTGLWGEGARVAALQAHFGTEHLTSLRKSELNEFAVMSFDAAKAKVTEDPDHG